MMMMNRGGSSNERWERLKPLLPPQKPKIGKPNNDHRTVVNGILWILRTGFLLAKPQGKPTAAPTLHSVFQCFMSIHLVTVAQTKQVINLTPERHLILNFFGSPCRKYYLLC